MSPPETGGPSEDFGGGPLCVSLSPCVIMDLFLPSNASVAVVLLIQYGLPQNGRPENLVVDQLQSWRSQLRFTLHLYTAAPSSWPQIDSSPREETG